MHGILQLLLILSVGQAADLTVGSATAKPGQRATGFIQVPAGTDAASNIPIIVINGASAGPKLALVAGSHGTEYASIVALARLAQVIDPSSLSGALIIVPLVNPASFLQKVPHLNPTDDEHEPPLPGQAGRDPDPNAYPGRSGSRLSTSATT